MSWIKANRGGVRITFEGPLMVDSTFTCQTSYPSYQGATPAKLPKIYWRSSGDDTYRLAPVAGNVTFTAGETWVEFVLHYDIPNITNGNELDNNVFDGKFVVKLIADPADPQFPDFGERSYNIKYTAISRFSGNRLQVANIQGSGLGGWEPPNVCMFARIYAFKPLVKPRKLYFNDCAGNPIANNTGHASLLAKYPVDPAATAAPWSILSSPTGFLRVTVLGTNYSFVNFLQPEADGGYILPINTRLIGISRETTSAAITNAVTAQNNAGWTGAFELFDEITIECYDHGPWAPMFMGRDLSFETEKASWPCILTSSR